MKNSVFDGFNYELFRKRVKRCYNVHQLREALNMLPGGMLVNGDDGIYPMVVNVGIDGVGANKEHLVLEDEQDDDE